MFHMSHVTFFFLSFFQTKWWSLLVKGLFSTGFFHPTSHAVDYKWSFKKILPFLHLSSFCSHCTCKESTFYLLYTKVKLVNFTLLLSIVCNLNVEKWRVRSYHLLNLSKLTLWTSICWSSLKDNRPSTQ